MHLKKNNSSESLNYHCFLFFFYELKAMVMLIHPHQGLIKKNFCRINEENNCLNFLFSL